MNKWKTTSTHFEWSINRLYTYRIEIDVVKKTGIRKFKRHLRKKLWATGRCIEMFEVVALEYNRKN